MKRSSLKICAILVLVLVTCKASGAPAVDGMDCTGVPWIRAESCEAWKKFNEHAARRWWVRFSPETGSVSTIFEHRGERVPGIDLRTITRESARSDQATRALVEAYAKKRLSEFRDVLGLRNQDLRDLYFGDFRMERGESFPHVIEQAGEPIEETRSTLPIYHLVLQQKIDRIPVRGALIDVIVDEGNHLRSIWSSYRNEPISGPSRARLDSDGATALAIAAGVIDPTEIASIGARLVWISRSGKLELAWEVNLATPPDESSESVILTILDRDGTILAVRSLGGSFAVAMAPSCPLSMGEGTIFKEYRDGLGLAFDTHPPMRFWRPDPDYSVDGFVDRLETVALQDLCVYQGPLAPVVNGTLFGRYARIVNSPQRESYEFLPHDRVHAAVRLDLRSLTSEGLDDAPFVCPEVDIFEPSCLLSTPAHPTGEETIFLPHDLLDLADENLVDRTMAYHGADRTARFFASRFGYELDREFNGSPLPVYVNTGYKKGGNSAYLCAVQGFDWDDFGPNINCWITMGHGKSLIPVENDYLALGVVPVDAYAALDQTRDASVIAHEYTHAVTTDINGLVLSEHTSSYVQDHVLGDEGVTPEFFEGIADYFAATLLDQPSNGEWIRRERDFRDCGADVQGGRNIAPTTPFVVPYSLEHEAHGDGRAFASSFWDLRTRMDLLSSQIGIPGAHRHLADRIAFGAIQRLGRRILHYSDILDKSLDTDKDAFEKLLHYEILAAFARHGIKSDDTIAVIQPADFIVDGRNGTDLRVTGFLGDGGEYVAEFTTDPRAFDGIHPVDRQSDRSLPGFNYIRLASAEENALPRPRPISYLKDAGSCGTSAVAPDAKNNVVDLVVANADLELLSQGKGREALPIFMRIASVGPGIGELGEPVRSHVVGAGGLLDGHDEVVSIYVSSTVPPGCSCRLDSTTQRRGPWLFAIASLAVLWARRKLRD